MNKKTLKLILKIVLTAGAIYLVFRKIDAEATWKVIRTAQWFDLFLATLFFALSKLFSSVRLNCYFRNLGLRISEEKNLKLYSIGMFYNLFLPGGIGGDGYKVYLLNKYHQSPVKSLLAAVFLDRLNGLAALVFLMFGLLFFVDIQWPLLEGVSWDFLAVLGLAMVPLSFKLIVQWWFKTFSQSVLKTGAYSILTQVSQLICAYFILTALGINEKIIAYQFVFLLSSIVAVLPLTIGGVGARELVFIYSHQYIGIDKNAAVAFSLVFFLITALVSLIGAFIKVEWKEKELNRY
ncbi:lysylphosphatidylglycerol synthase transmembrane domain-containing protein [Echinicola jeungdonensis]|uniref:Lysylphosphatidylglycerol synthase transmembrane domain-containing protein n=1 Tax=Echinicola jeungdonensis TaxID=709343 RepID=A0ABV5J4U6_9BACT|nr:lysylphosphatidylglycerol synthase transmembrane domain-containing protein [Echinicola jeungdonensis]MDN3668827.1 lysylphosphatidylglycerol synthase transmembrane domain-containing protein [Echinicola jeungdonensis]